MNKFKLAGVTALGMAISGCLNMSGLDASSNFACEAPEGVLCESMTGVLANANANNLPAQQVHKKKDGAEGSPAANPARPKPTQQRAMPVPQYSGAPLVQEPKKIRVWVAPWEGADRTLYDQQYFYMVLDDWRWVIEHNQQRIKDSYAPVKAPVGGSNPSAGVKVNAVSGGMQNQLQNFQLPNLTPAGAQ